jgi:hypothetical protein
MSKKKEETVGRLLSEVERLQREMEDLKKLDLDTILSSGRSSRATTSRKSRHEKPDWVKDWNRKNASHGAVTTIVKTTDTFHEESGIIDSKTELVEPVTTTTFSRNLKTGEVEEKITSAGLPGHLRLGVLHEDREPPIAWDDRPTSDAVPPRGLTAKEIAEWDAKNPGNPLTLRDEGPTKPVRKQMLRMNKVWKYRNFKKCANCEKYDTWEARTEPYALANVGVVHAEIWCHTCGAVDFEVADNMPSHIGSWSPPRETDKEKQTRAKRQAYRRERSLYSLIEKPKTAMQLCAWFREVEGYKAVDAIMIELMLVKMRKEGLVVLKDGLWWDAEDRAFYEQEQSMT